MPDVTCPLSGLRNALAFTKLSGYDSLYFSLFSDLKEKFGGKKFSDIEEVIVKTVAYCKTKINLSHLQK